MPASCDNNTAQKVQLSTSEAHFLAALVIRPLVNGIIPDPVCYLVKYPYGMIKPKMPVITDDGIEIGKP